MKIQNIQPIQLHTKIDWTLCVTSIDYRKAKDPNKVAKFAMRILNIILKNTVELTIRENISSGRDFLTFPGAPNFFCIKPWRRNLLFFMKDSA